ncbi:MAG: hypothetical protein KC933_00410 [Myxococcales bacterium]|nr:hypothetical protein [Myxococcales bacterium]MCB9649585.1 hypothetical protein [Deltaproteobacteria bacterium]
MPCLADGECPPACETNEDCEGLAYCSPTFAEGDARMVHRCVQQDCAGPSDKSSCGPGRSCVPMSNEGSGVYRCLQAGLRKVGEPCLLGAELNPHSLDQVCGPGLKCLDSCMPIQCEEDADCPGGRCAMMRAHMQKSCLPGCKVDADCPAWQRCATASIGLRCVPRASPKTCIEEGCPDGLRCVPYMPLLALQVAECRPPCETTDDCSGGQVCLDLGLPFQEGPVCVVPCTSDGSCGPGLRCLPHPSTDVAVCGIDPGAHVDAFFRGFGDVRSASEPEH